MRLRGDYLMIQPKGSAEWVTPYEAYSMFKAKYHEQPKLILVHRLTPLDKKDVDYYGKAGTLVARWSDIPKGHAKVGPIPGTEEDAELPLPNGSPDADSDKGREEG
jgi:hypothetical protein